MFTGIITSVGTVAEVQQVSNARRVTLATTLDTSGWQLGCSVACAGICLTVVKKSAQRFTVDISPETLSKTTAGNWSAGTRINLEGALRAGDELGGHLVSGHVDGSGRVISMEDAGAGHRIFTVEAPAELMKLIAPKGSITVDGVSLTVNGVADNRFTMNLIPHTLDVTTLGDLKAGDSVNLEADMLAQYVWQTLANVNK